MSKYNRRLVYIDGFAGPGVYKDGESRSPIIALNAFLEHKQRDLIDAELVYIFIEEDEARVDRLNQELEKLGRLPDQVRTHVEYGTFDDTFSRALDAIEEQNAYLAPTANTSPSQFCDPRIDRQIKVAFGLEATDPAIAASLWSQLDREIVDQAPVVPLVNPKQVDFLSSRVGNFQYNPQLGMLLDQLWVR